MPTCLSLETPEKEEYSGVAEEEAAPNKWNEKSSRHGGFLI